MNKRLMLECYSMLYDIETWLKMHVTETLVSHYGPNWHQQLHEVRDPYDCYFHELIAFLGKYPHLFPQFDLSTRKQLYQLTNIRNKICHMQLITQSEYDHLKHCHQLITDLSEFYISQKSSTLTFLPVIFLNALIILLPLDGEAQTLINDFIKDEVS